jgi:hypothetical protein
MKKLLVILLFAPLFSQAQKSKAFFNVSAEALNLSNKNTSFGGSFSIGGKGKYVDLGVGVILTQFRGANGPYIPAFVDLYIHSRKNIARPFINLQAGWGFYDNQIYSGLNEKGEFFLRPGAGISVPFGKTSFFIRAFYVRSAFRVVNNTGQKFDSFIETGWSASLGVSL